MRDRLLIRHFLWRFLEHDLVSPSSDRRGVLSAVGGLVVTMSLFAAFLMAISYQFNNELPPGMTSLASLDDRFVFVSMSMLVMALAAVAQWDALMLDARDTAVLGTLPIRHVLIVRTKFAATGLFALAMLAAWNVCPTVLRPVAVPIYLHVGWAGLLKLTLAHGLVTCAAGAFAFLAVLALRETAYALLGPSLFSRVSPTLQAALLIGLTTALLLLPGHSREVGRRWLANTSPAAEKPPLWFVGLHETVAGSVFDSLPRTPPPRYFAREEARATIIYRSLRPEFPAFAVRALAAFLGATIIAAAMSLWNSRRLPSLTTRPQTSRGIASQAWNWLAATIVVRTPLQQAGFFFAVQSISRRASHRVTMATAVAAALSLLIVVGFRPAFATDDVRSLSIAFLATQSLVIGALLIGFRHATRLPAELRGGPTFGIAWPGAAAPFMAGVKRAGWMTVLLPSLAIMFVWYLGTLGAGLALLHLGVGTAVAIVAMDVLFFRNRRVPFASVYVPTSDSKAASAVYGAAALVAALVVALVERASFEAPWLYMGLLATLLTIGACLRRVDRVSPEATIALDVDEQASLPTQRLTLSS